ncbi:MAG: hypothetical protein D6743_05285 [Calditrichaeota bacterium]|nr:MAG: hypothetical protein D6743_05285 [Calditrichota bacterium]
MRALSTYDGNGGNGHVKPQTTSEDRPVAQGSEKPLMRDRIARLVRESPGHRVHALLNRFLFWTAVTITVTAPVFVWYTKTELGKRSLARPTKTERLATAAGQAPGADGTGEKIDPQRQYFRTQKPDAGAAADPSFDASEVPSLAERFTLLGILVGQTPQAIVKDNSTGASIFLEEGQSLEGYKVKAIFSDRLVLERDGELVNLRI